MDRALPRGGFEIHRELVLGRDAATVFDFLVDPTKFSVVDHALVDVEPMKPLELGAGGRMTHRRGGMTARTTWMVTSFERPRSLTVEIVGSGYAMTESAALASTATGSHVTFVDRVWPTSLPGWLLVRLSRRIMERDLRARSELLAAALEP